MKRPINLRKGFGLPELLAYATIRKAIRPLLRADAFVVVLVVPPGMQAGPYFRVADHIIKDGSHYRRGNAVVEFDRKRVEASMISMVEALEDRLAKSGRSRHVVLSADRVAARPSSPLRLLRPGPGFQRHHRRSTAGLGSQRTTMCPKCNEVVSLSGYVIRNSEISFGADSLRQRS